MRRSFGDLWLMKVVVHGGAWSTHGRPRGALGKADGYSEAQEPRMLYMTFLSCAVAPLCRAGPIGDKPLCDTCGDRNIDEIVDELSCISWIGPMVAIY